MVEILYAQNQRAGRNAGGMRSQESDTVKLVKAKSTKIQKIQQRLLATVHSGNLRYNSIFTGPEGKSALLSIWPDLRKLWL